jgi:hypothetical protein
VGVSRSLKKLEKYGSLKYLAQWQGLRGEDLDVDLAGQLHRIQAKSLNNAPGL